MIQVTVACPRCGGTMAENERFRFDHEPTDSAQITDMLRGYVAMGIRLGADMVLYNCAACDTALVKFVYDDER